MALHQQQRVTAQQKAHSKGLQVRSLEEADSSSPSDTGPSITPVSPRKDTSTAVPTLKNSRIRSPIPYRKAKNSGQQSVSADADAGADGVGTLYRPIVPLNLSQISKDIAIQTSI